GVEVRRIPDRRALPPVGVVEHGEHLRRFAPLEPRPRLSHRREIAERQGPGINSDNAGALVDVSPDFAGDVSIASSMARSSTPSRILLTTWSRAFSLVRSIAPRTFFRFSRSLGLGQKLTMPSRKAFVAPSMASPAMAP